ncbi:cyclase family protein [Natronosalvus caseinilyticus]|uniref:cyclase family protein n=1 Tax=Natronosalvus caseinilyticus TaxID=2953747 RepID=UPI0028AD5F71|nr:cyclase family protein [Natronosalvus caseinilyticus]
MPVHDLSYPLETGMPVYPGSPPVAVEPATTVEDDGYATTNLSFDSHTGTHVDAPAHMRSDGPTLDDFDVERFRFRAILADCRPLEPREPVGADDLERAVAADADADTTGNEDEDVDLLVCRTGWETHWGTDRAFDHPYLTASAADWLVERELDLGIDAMNVDPTPGSDPAPDEPDGYPFHRTMFADDRILLENLRGVEALPVGEVFTVHAYPLAVANADGAPVRAVAVLE